MKDEALDFLPMVALMGIVLSISLNLLMPLYATSRNLKYSERYDKTAVWLDGGIYDDDNYGESEENISGADTVHARYPVVSSFYLKNLGKVYEDAYMYSNFSYEEIILVIGSQTYFMPSPRIIDVGSKVLTIQADATAINKPNVQWKDNNTTEFIPENRGSLATVKNAVFSWCAAHTNRYANSNGFKLHFDLRFSTGINEGENDDCYALHAVGFNWDPEEKGATIKYFRCLPGGTLENYNPPENATGKGDYLFYYN